ncbi:MAG TPA: Mov34/MPN/PAD-1 family protein [Candidatus Margulisiibacteriota bacterium]|nr:Mov34/MPN/PAD-1 family protein [Candidatus Margulisiibacteriota bacterium]
MSRANIAAVCRHARAAFPNECCGFIIERQGRREVVRVSNVQNQLHAKDPMQFPRSARTAYTMRWKEVEPLLEAAYRGQIRLVAVYHSHPKHGAYFSAWDRAAAEGWVDDPNYATAGQIVVSVHRRRVCRMKGFAWDATVRGFVEVEIEISGA